MCMWCSTLLTGSCSQLQGRGNLSLCGYRQGERAEKPGWTEEECSGQSSAALCKQSKHVTIIIAISSDCVTVHCWPLEMFLSYLLLLQVYGQYCEHGVQSKTTKKNKSNSAVIILASTKFQYFKKSRFSFVCSSMVKAFFSERKSSTSSLTVVFYY